MTAAMLGVLAAWLAVAGLLAWLAIRDGASWTPTRAFAECLMWPVWIVRLVLNALQSRGKGPG